MNASIMSPSLISLNFSTLNPHSYPAATSFASSLNLFNEANVDSDITIPSLRTRTLLFLVILPVNTYHPAMVPTFETLYICLISTLPKTTSLYTGSSIPTIAAFISSIAS